MRRRNAQLGRTLKINQRHLGFLLKAMGGRAGGRGERGGGHEQSHRGEEVVSENGIFKFIFILGCVGSLLMCAGFL